jgi:hypothetical protein
MLAVALALRDQVPQVRHRHVGAVHSEQRFLSILPAPVATRADQRSHAGAGLRDHGERNAQAGHAARRLVPLHSDTRMAIPLIRE